MTKSERAQRVPQNWGGRDKQASTGGLGLHLLILAAPSCAQLQSREVNMKYIHPTFSFPLHFTQSCPFKFKKTLKNKTMQACIKTLNFPLKLEGKSSEPALQSRAPCDQEHLPTSDNEPPPFLLYVLSLISPSKSLQECD